MEVLWRIVPAVVALRVAGGFLTRRMRYLRADVLLCANGRKSVMADIERFLCELYPDGRIKRCFLPSCGVNRGLFFCCKVALECKIDGTDRPFHPIDFAKHPKGHEKGPLRGPKFCWKAGSQGRPL